MKKLFEVRRYYYYRVDKSSDGAFLNRDIEVRPISMENYREIDSYNQALLPVFRSFLMHDNFGLYGYLNGKLVAYAWSILNKRSKCKRVRAFFSLLGDAACVHYCRVLDEYQGRKIYQTMLAYLYRELFQKVNFVYLDTEISNVPAQRAIEKSGGQLQGMLVRVMLLGKTVVTFKRVKR